MATQQQYIPRAQYLQQLHNPPPSTKVIPYEPRGAVKELFYRRDKELVIAGPAGTGKTRGCLEKVNWFLDKYPRARGFMVRKTRRSLTQTAMVTFEEEVLRDRDTGQMIHNVPFHGGEQEYRYSNGSILHVAGMDDPQKILSSQWDIGFCPQVEELDEGDWETLIRTRMRNRKAPYAQGIGDANPGPPEHWILGRRAKGSLAMLESRHEDNPVLYDAVNQCFTAYGVEYLHDLEQLTGARLQRLRYGKWVGAEGTVYEDVWDPAIHVIDRFVKEDLTHDQVPKSWTRYWTVDFGFTNPFVWQAWAEDPDGRLFRYKEIYKTKTLVEDHAKRILEITKDEPRPRWIVCDHDAEDRATLEKHLGLETKRAWKAVSPGIQAVATRLRKAGDGKPRLFYLRDSVVDLDKELLAKHKPTCTEAEYDVYVWDTSSNKKKGEEPVKEYDHGQDSTRYLVTKRDETWKIKYRFGSMGSVTRADVGGGEPEGLEKFGGESTIGSRWGSFGSYNNDY